MNRDSDIVEDSLLRLLLEALAVEDDPAAPSPGLAAAPLGSHPAPTPTAPSLSPEPPAPPLLDGDVLDIYSPVFDSGDLAVVQPHFEALLKRRLRQEIAHRPPLFPWEKSLQDYPDHASSGAPTVWLDHLKTLPLPGTLPNDVLVTLFHECQRVAQGVQQSGRRLVLAVEAIFPDQPQTLEYVAGLVARPAYRSAQAQTLDRIDYATASVPQQVALAMLAAQGIFDALSLTVSADAPTQSQTWLTAWGPLTLTASYLAANDQLEVRALLPAAGSLVMNSAEETVGSKRSTPGDLVLRLASSADSPYRIEVSVDPEAIAPLSFQVTVAL